MAAPLPMAAQDRQAELGHSVDAAHSVDALPTAAMPQTVARFRWLLRIRLNWIIRADAAHSVDALPTAAKLQIRFRGCSGSSGCTGSGSVDALPTAAKLQMVDCSGSQAELDRG